MRLRWPTTSPSLDIVIPNPQEGNTETWQTNTIVRETRSQELKTFKATEWLINKTHKYSIRTMNQTEKDNFLDFLIQSAGDEILLTDSFGSVWTGIIITQIPEIVTVKDSCSYDVEFEFLGRL